MDAAQTYSAGNAITVAFKKLERRIGLYRQIHFCTGHEVMKIRGGYSELLNSVMKGRQNSLTAMFSRQHSIQNLTPRLEAFALVPHLFFGIGYVVRMAHEGV